MFLIVFTLSSVAGNDWFVDQFDKILFDDLLIKTDGNGKDPFTLDDLVDATKTKDVPAAKKSDNGLNGNQVLQSNSVMTNTVSTNLRL